MLRNLNNFKGEFLGVKTSVSKKTLCSVTLTVEMVERHNGTGLYSEDEARAFKPYTIKIVNGERIAVVGQAFPRTANANPQSNFPDWSFGLREDALQELVEAIREKENQRQS